MLWCVTTRSTTVITSSGGMMVSALSMTEPMLTSRSRRFSSNTRPISQPRENGRSASESPRARRISRTSPAQAWARRNSSTATAEASPSVRGSRTQTTLRVWSVATSSPAVPSLNSSTTGGGGVVEPCTRNSCFQRSRSALADRPWSRAQATREAGDGVASPGVGRKSAMERSTPLWRATAATASRRDSPSITARPTPMVPTSMRGAESCGPALGAMPDPVPFGAGRGAGGLEPDWSTDRSSCHERRVAGPGLPYGLPLNI